MLAKIGILNEKILSQNEANLLVQDLKNENVAIWNIAEALTYATASIATNDREIALLIKLPKLDQRIFKKILILPTWFNSQQIHIHNNNYLNHGNQYYVVDDLQPTIFDTKKAILDESQCIPNLLEAKPSRCDYLSNPTETIISIDDQHLITNILGSFTLRTDCGLSERNLSGTYLITYINCQVTINNQTYTNEIQNIKGGPIHLPLYGIPIEKGKEIVNLSLQHLHDLHLQTRKEMELINLQATSLQWPHITIFGGLSIFPIVLGIALFYFLYRRPRIDERPMEPKNASRAKFSSSVQEPTQQSFRPSSLDQRQSFRELTLAEVLRTESQDLGGAS